jgi:mannose-6-phosphate isomerase-like protein (cupin superfamily)
MILRIALRSIIATWFLFIGVSATKAADLTEVTVIPGAKTQAALDNKADLRLLVADDIWIEGAFRDKAGSPELHTDQTNVFYITNGSATVVAGGTYVGGKAISPGQVRGGTIVGGSTYNLAKGDTIVIPAGKPVWFEAVPSTVSYYVVKMSKTSPH